MIWEPRDELIRIAIKYGLNARQISLLTLSCPQPIRTSQGVYDLIGSRGWERLYRSAQAKHRRKDFHDRQLNILWAKLVGQALEYGHPIDEFMRDQSPIEGLRFRPDLGMRIGDRLFFAELQLSKLEYTRWTEKMRHYLRLYKLVKRPFRVLFVIAKESNISKARHYARLVLCDRPQLNLFLFMTMEQFARERDVLCGKVWIPTWHSRDPVSLM